MTTKPRKKVHVWVVEMRLGGGWEPCVRCNLVKRVAQEEAREYRHNNPDDTFRVTRYERAA